MLAIRSQKLLSLDSRSPEDRGAVGDLISVVNLAQELESF